MSEDPDEELGESSEQLNGIAQRFNMSETNQTSEMNETSESTPPTSPEMSETSATTETRQSAETIETSSDPDELNIREDWNGRTIYLPDEDVEELDLRYDEYNLQWRREHGEKLPKNERFYPAVMRAALNGTSIEEELGLEK